MAKQKTKKAKKIGHDGCRRCARFFERARLAVVENATRAREEKAKGETMNALHLASKASAIQELLESVGEAAVSFDVEGDPIL